VSKKPPECLCLVLFVLLYENPVLLDSETQEEKECINDNLD